jgi:putative transposase
MNRRSPERQRPRRQLEWSVRQTAVHVYDGSRQQGWTLAQTAQRLRLAPRTLRQWSYDLGRDAVPVKLLGRPLLSASPQQRNEVIEVLTECGPAVGVPGLRALFPAMARAQLQNLLSRFRRLCRQQRRQALAVLHWAVPGRVWALDFSEPPAPIDGRYSYLLAVRDLATGQQLMWLPTLTMTAAETILALHSLFALAGAPLILKSDNGSAFIADLMGSWLERFGVIPLFSPPRRPQYNGSIEAGTGSLKTRAEMHASRMGRPGQWTFDDVAAALHEANVTARPHGPSGPSPEQAWSQRTPITAPERSAFQTAVARYRHEADSAQRLRAPDQRADDRRAICRALVECGYLCITRR